MFQKAVLTRYATYTVGIATTVVNMFMITYFLDVNEFAVWGIASSIIYVFSQLGQLTYVQYIDKFFPNMSLEECKLKINQFLKTICLFSPLWLSLFFIMDGLGYFSKFYIENIYILFLMLTSLVVLESSIEITSKYMLAINKSQSFDLNEFITLKLLRSLLFFVFLYSGFSIYHLFFISILLRSYFLLSILARNEESVLEFLKNIISANVFKNNFVDIHYTTVAFIIKTLQTTFLNVIFLIYSSFSVNTEIATFSLGILIINNLRPVISSFSSLLTPIISKRAKIGNESSNFLTFTSFLNTLISSFFVAGSFIIFIYRGLISEYFFEYTGNVIFVIVFSIIGSTFMSIYQPTLMFIKFSEKEKELLKLVFFNYLFLLIIFSFLQYFNLGNLIIFYMLFEIINLVICNYLFIRNFEKRNLFIYSYSYILNVVYLVMISINITINLYLAIVSILFFYLIDFYRLKINNIGYSF